MSREVWKDRISVMEAMANSWMLRGVKLTSEKLTRFDKQVVPGDLGKAVSGEGRQWGWCQIHGRVPWRVIVGMKLLNLTARLYLTLFKKKLPNCLPKWLHHFEFLPAVNGTSSWCISLPASDVISALDFSHFNRQTSWLYQIGVLVCHSLVTYDIEQLFICLFATCVSSLVRCLFRSFAYFLTGMLDFWL